MLKKTDSKVDYNAKEMYEDYLHIYAEANPNPNSMKFAFSKVLMHDGAVKDYPEAPDASEAPLCSALFERFDWLTRAFFSQNYITLTKGEQDENEWPNLIPVVRQWLQEYFEAGHPVFPAQDEDTVAETAKDENPKIQQIKDILEEYIRPAVEMDGGAIVFREFHEAEGVLVVELQGACSGCPSSMVTLKSGIQNLFSHMMPEVKEVVAKV